MRTARAGRAGSRFRSFGAEAKEQSASGLRCCRRGRLPSALSCALSLALSPAKAAWMAGLGTRATPRPHAAGRARAPGCPRPPAAACYHAWRPLARAPRRLRWWAGGQAPPAKQHVAGASLVTPHVGRTTPATQRVDQAPQRKVRISPEPLLATHRMNWVVLVMPHVDWASLAKPSGQRAALEASTETVKPRKTRSCTTSLDGRPPIGAQTPAVAAALWRAGVATVSGRRWTNDARAPAVRQGGRLPASSPRRGLGGSAQSCRGALQPAPAGPARNCEAAARGGAGH